MSRLQQILVGVLAIQIIIVILVFLPRGGPIEAGSSLLGEIILDDINEFTVSDGDGNQVNLSKTGADWVLPQADNFPADGEKIVGIIEKLLAIQANRLVTRTSASHQRLQVSADDFLRRVVLNTSSGPVADMLIGSSAGASATHVRLADQDEVYLTGEFNSWEVDATPSSWIDTTYTSLNAAEITSVVIENSNGVFEFNSEAEGEWTYTDLGDNEVFDESSFTTILNRIVALRMTAPLGIQEKPAYGLSPPTASVQLSTPAEGGKIIQIRIGALDPDDESYFAHASDSQYYVKVSRFSVDSLVELAREDLIQEPPTPTPEAG